MYQEQTVQSTLRVLSPKTKYFLYTGDGGSSLFERASLTLSERGYSYLGDDIMTPYPPPAFQSEEADKLIMKSALIIEPKSYIQCRPLRRNMFEKSQ